ncbi:neutral/alkaline non-lysosomal ceramidase N-terminal domain-containing protein [Prosthecobacter sp.]|uniref:neutral/alkaline non-lysosomal ceramidase N-terminal domain-containing protein n=1 Tax=Prosthecobacter sp. TaxID=1965333 RepID=UPI003783830D
MKILSVLVSLFLLSSQVQAEFRAGVAAVDITPKTFPRIIAGGFLEGRGEKIADKLHVRSFVLDDGKMKIAFAIVDTCMMEQSLIDEAKALASKQCGIPMDRMMVSATHTHSAPAAMGCLGTRKDTEYGKFLTPKIAEAIVVADKALQPARIGWGSFDDWEHTHNRRWIRLPGKEVVDPFGEPTGRANMHPGYLSKDVVGPSGPVDPQLSVISLQTKDGKPLGVLANYSQHYFGSGPISSDYYGLFCKHLAQKMGQPGEGNSSFVCAMSQGTSGDQMWMDYGAEKKTITLDAYADAIADSAMQALKEVTYDDQATLSMMEETLLLNYRTPDEKRLAWARPIAAKIVNDVPKDKQEVYAREALILHERQKTTVKLQAIRIGTREAGDLTITTMPNEVYALTGLMLRWNARFATHFNISLANGAEGYIPPEEQHALGGYTTWPARTAGLEVGAEETIRGMLGLMLEKINPSRGRGYSYDAPAYTMAVIDSLEKLHLDFQYGTDFGRNEAGVEVSGGHALWLPGVGAGLGYGDESHLKTEVRVPPDKINRSIHLAGGHIRIPKLGLAPQASIGLWFWLGHESGASDRTGELIDALGVSLKAHQDASHRVRLTLGGEETKGDLRADDWHFAVLIRDGENVRVHVDGSEKPVLSGKAGVAKNDLLFGEGLEGRLDEITFWDRVIEPSVVAKLWDVSKVAEDNVRHAIARKERAKQAQAQNSALLKGHENWSASMRFRSTKANEVSPVTAYLISRGPKGDHQAPGDHLGIGGNFKDSQPGRLFVFNGNAANQIVRGQTIIAPGTSNEVKLERQGNHVKVMLNGKVEIDTELSVTAPGSTELFFGRRCDDFAPLQGEYSEVVVAGLEKPTAATPAKPKVELASQPLSPEESAKKWHLREGYRIELVAAEPVVLDPVAFDWDDKGRLWVIEMADYPLGMDGNGKPGGRVVMLEDENGDGRYDKRTVIVNDLSYPTGILAWREGVLVTAAPDLFFIKPNGEKQVLYTGFSTGNQQLRVNGLRWGMDGWVYCAAGAHHGGYNKGTQIECKLTGQKIDLGSRDFRFKPDTGEFDPQSGPSQFGRTRDDWGHWFGVQNSYPLWHFVLQDHYLRRNPHVIPPDPIHQLFQRNPPVYPASSMEKRFHSFDQSGRFTSACGIEMYRDRVLFDDGKTHAFTCEPFHNVVQHHVLEDDGVTFKATRDPAEAKMDFLASEDRWCRPVMVRTGPDGALWVADMYRYMIEHPQWLPQNGKDELLPHYREGDNKGRIWKVVRSSEPVKGETKIQGLASTNGWQRDKAQMELMWSGAKTSLDPLLDEKLPQARAQAAWTLLATGRLTTAMCLKLLADESPRVREQALQMAERLEWKGDESGTLHQALMKLTADTDAKVRLQLACSVGEWHEPGMSSVLVELMKRDSGDPIILGAILSSASDFLLEISEHAPDAAFEPLVGMAIHAWYEAALANLCDRMLIHDEFKDSLEPRLLLLHKFLLIAQAQGTTILKMKERARTERLTSYLEELMQYTNAAMTIPWDWKDAPLSALIAMGEIPVMVPGWEAKGYETLQNWLAYSRADLQQAAVNVLGRHPKPETDDLLLDKLPTATPLLKQDILTALLSHEDGALKLLTGMKNGKLHLAGLMDAATQTRLLQHPSKPVKALAKVVLQETGASKRADVLAKFKPALKLKGDATKGKQVFAQACITCHKLDGVGIDLGPDLRSVVEHDAEKLMNSILDPSAIIEPGFMAYNCTLKSGEQLYGVIATETSASLTLKMAGNVTKSVLRSEITSLQSTGMSLMPEGLEAALSPQSLADLIAYLKVPK